MAIELTVLWMRFGTLPRAGGFLDQDWYLMHLIEVCSDVIKEKDKLREDIEEEEERQKRNATRNT